MNPLVESARVGSTLSKEEIEKHIQYRVVSSEALCTTATIHGIAWGMKPDSKLQTTFDQSVESKTIREIYAELGLEIKYADQPICFECPNEKEVSHLTLNPP